MRVLVVVPTFYSDLTDVRYALFLQLCQNVAQHHQEQLELIVIDGSPPDQHRKIQEQMEPYSNFIHIHPQTIAGKKGAALRQGIRLAGQMVAANNGNDSKQDAIIGFQEPEKVDMIRHWNLVCEEIIQHNADICVAQRSDASFRATYPIEQYHSEQFANLHFQSLAAKCAANNSNSNNINPHDFPLDLDWTMGPIAFRTAGCLKVQQLYEQFEGELWDMQLVPMIRAYRWHGAKIISSSPLDYHHPTAMKEQEEGQPKWNEKRLFQLNFLFEHLGTAWTEEVEGGGTSSTTKTS